MQSIEQKFEIIKFENMIKELPREELVSSMVELFALYLSKESSYKEIIKKLMFPTRV